MSSASADTTSKKIAGKRPLRACLRYARAGLFVVLAAVCVVQALRTRRQVLKYSVPPEGKPAVELNSEVQPVPALGQAHYQFVDEDFVEPFDPRPAVAQLADRVQAITERITQLSAAGQADRAADMQVRLDTILTRREGPYSQDGVPQLHAIGMYCGGAPWVSIAGMRSKGRGTARIKVTHHGVPLVLVFCAYFPMHWILEVEPNIQIQRVILCGHYSQEIEGQPSDVTIEGQVNDHVDPAYSFYAETALEGLPVAKRLEELTGLKPTTFQIMRQYQGTPVIIGPSGDEWTAAMAMFSLGPLYKEAVRECRRQIAQELVGQHFADVSCSIVSRSNVVEAALAQYSIFGPYASSLQPLERGSTQLVIDPRGPTLFGFQRNQGIVVFDGLAGAARHWPVPTVEFRSHRETYLAYDTRRNRLLAWDVNLLAIDPDTHEATVVREGNPFVRGLAHSPAEDLLYACCASSQRESVCNQVTITDLCTFTAQGEEVSRVKLGVPIPGGDWNDTTPAIKMRIVGDKILVTAIGSCGCSDTPYISSDTNYVFDPKTGRLLLACRRKPR